MFIKKKESKGSNSQTKKPKKTAAITDGHALQYCCHTRTDLVHNSKQSIHKVLKVRPFTMRAYKECGHFWCSVLVEILQIEM